MHHREIEHQRQLINRSGLGLLPGLGLAFALVLIAMGALVLEAWWVTFAVLAFLFVVTAAVVWVVYQMTDDTAVLGDG